MHPMPVYTDLPKGGPGTKEGSDDLICWLRALHVAHVDAGDVYDMDGYRFFFLWYSEVAGDWEGCTHGPTR